MDCSGEMGVALQGSDGHPAGGDGPAASLGWEGGSGGAGGGTLWRRWGDAGGTGWGEAVGAWGWHWGGGELCGEYGGQWRTLRVTVEGTGGL